MSDKVVYLFPMRDDPLYFEKRYGHLLWSEEQLEEYQNPPIPDNVVRIDEWKKAK